MRIIFVSVQTFQISLCIRLNWIDINILADTLTINLTRILRFFYNVNLCGCTTVNDCHKDKDKEIVILNCALPLSLLRWRLCYKTKIRQSINSTKFSCETTKNPQDNLKNSQPNFPVRQPTNHKFVFWGFRNLVSCELSTQTSFKWEARKSAAIISKKIK